MLAGRRGAVTLAAVVAMTGCAVQAPKGSPARTPNVGRHAQLANGSVSGQLTKTGRLLQNFEALLRQQLGSHSVCVDGSKRQSLYFVNGGCAPLSRYNPYFYSFRSTKVGSLRLGDEAPRPGSLGNYPVPILIKGRYVRCNRSGFLAALRDTSSFTVKCVQPLA